MRGQHWIKHQSYLEDSHVLPSPTFLPRRPPAGQSPIEPLAQRSKNDLPAKACAACGRTITWRKKWRRCWDQVRFCSDRCRRQRPGDRDAVIERRIVELLGQRRRGATICPSEVARSLGGDDGGDHDWRAWMEPVRCAARRLVVARRLEITQRGQIVEPSTARGPIRLRLAPPP